MIKQALFISVLAVSLLAASLANASSFVDFNGLVDYPPQSDGGTITVLGSGTEVKFENNVWGASYQPLTIFSNTILSFSYKSTDIPEIAGIGFDTDANFTNNQDNFFITWGTQGWGNNVLGYNGNGEYNNYTVNLFDYFSVGTEFNYIIFVSDDDGKVNEGGNGISNSYFKNASISATPVPGSLWLLGSGLFGLVGWRSRIRFFKD